MKPQRSAPWARALTLVGLVLASVVPRWAGAAEVGSAAAPIRMLFRDKPPYSYMDNGSPKGFLFDRTRKVLDLAGIHASYEMLPPKRLFAEIEANLGPVCSFGWYKIPSREAYAKFSRPIHQDRPHVVLASRKVSARLRALDSLADLRRQKDLTVAAADGVSYGPDLDSFLREFAGQVDRPLLSPMQIAQSIAAGRADFMFVDQDDLDYMRGDSAAFVSLGVQAIEFRDLPPGLRRYILCSRSVDDRLIERMNDAIMRVLP